jgi:peptidyl-prolyl cis-trans isomerase D
MLKVFRQKSVAKFVLWMILILILPAFVLWGTGSLGRSKEKGPTYAGSISNRKVSFERFAHGLTGVRCQIIMNYYPQPRILEQLLSNKELVGKLAWDRLIMEQLARDAKITATDKEVVDYVKSHPIFARDGKFDARLYDYVLRKVPIDPRSFEELARETIIIKKLNDAISKDVKITDDEVLESYKKEKGKLRIAYIVFAADDYVGKAKVDDEMMKEYYDKNKKEFKLPPKAGQEDASIEAIATFDEVKDNIKGYLIGAEARRLAAEAAEEASKKIRQLAPSGKTDIAAAAESLKMKKFETQPFSRTDYLNELGEAFPITEAASKMKPGEISQPVEVRKGMVIFTVIEAPKIDDGAFKKDKEEFAKRALDEKKMAYLEGWLRKLDTANQPLIDLKDYEKYYR